MNETKYYCDFCQKEVKSYRNGFNEWVLPLYRIEIKMAKPTQQMQIWSFKDKLLVGRSGEACEDCIKKTPVMKYAEQSVNTSQKESTKE